MPADSITEAQQRLPRAPSSPQLARHYRLVARWWELEARRGYDSSADSRRYAENMDWAAELVALFGPGTWTELLDRSGCKNPEAGRK